MAPKNHEPEAESPDMEPEAEGAEVVDESLQVFTTEDGTEFHPYADQDGKKCWRIGNQIISEDALLEFADDFAEDEE